MLKSTSFQSPRSGKFVSDVEVEKYELVSVSFNPLDRGNLYQIYGKLSELFKITAQVSIP